ncbi:MAG: hypothetical protein ABEH58_08970 [Haloplanus sp.]
MKIDPADRDTEANSTAEATMVDKAEGESESAVVGEVEPLTIGLPDGSESVSEAILSHRRMLTNPSEHGLASTDDAAEIRETVAELAEKVPEDLQEEMETLEASVEKLATGVDRQEQQIRELRDTVVSLAEILGTSVEFRTFGEDGGEDDA